MKKLLFFMSLVLLFISCEENKNGKDSSSKSDKLYYDIELKIVSINGETQISNDKFHKPQKCNIILFETVGLDKKYCEINTCDLPSCGCGSGPTIHIDTAWLYNHRIGDVVKFDFLLKERFFTINRNKGY